MIFELKIKTTEEDINACIAAAWEKAFDEVLAVKNIKPFKLGDTVSPPDVFRMMDGSCLRELLNKSEFEMERVG